MRETCKKCGAKIVRIAFAQKQKYDLLKLLRQDLKMFFLHKIRTDFNVNMQEAKFVLNHLSIKKHGKCIRCNYNSLKGEGIECPNCRAFNYNLAESDYNKELSSHPDWSLYFCSHLEWSLDFTSLEDEKVQGFWCDGVTYFLSLDIEKNKEVMTKAWLGKSGQEIYKMKIKFGEKSINNYKLGLSIIECIPGKDRTDWIKVYPEKKLIELELD